MESQWRLKKRRVMERKDETRRRKRRDASEKRKLQMGSNPK